MEEGKKTFGLHNHRAFMRKVREEGLPYFRKDRGLPPSITTIRAQKRRAKIMAGELEPDGYFKGFPKNGSLKRKIEWYVGKMQEQAHNAKKKGDAKLMLECLKMAVDATFKIADIEASKSPEAEAKMGAFEKHLQNMATQKAERLAMLKTPKAEPVQVGVEQ